MSLAGESSISILWRPAGHGSWLHTVMCLELLGPSELFLEIIFARPLENIKIRTPPSGFGPPLVDSVCGSPLAGFPGQPHCSSAKHEEGDTKPLETVPP